MTKRPGHFIAPDPAQLEAEARLLPKYELPEPAGEWSEHATSFGVRLRVPTGLDPADSDDPGSALWHGADGRVLHVLLHRGPGHFLMMLAFDDYDEGEDAPADSAVPLETEGEFQVPLAGRVGRMELQRATSPEGAVFAASAHAGIAQDCTVAVFIAAPTEAMRATLLAVIPTVRVDPGA
jgi:hypothetical protein